MNLIAVVSNNFDAFITVVVLIMSIILFIKNTIAPELTGLLCVGIFIATGVLSPEKALAGFGSPSLITLMGLFAVSSALFKSGALDRVRELISSESIRTPRKLISLIAFLIAPISGIVPNTPVVASLLPLIEGWCERRNISPSKVLLPLSFATLLGGTLTLLGSSVNLLVSDFSQQLGYGALELFSLTSIGIPVWLIGTTYMILVSDVLLPDRGRDKEFIKKDIHKEDFVICEIGGTVGDIESLPFLEAIRQFSNDIGRDKSLFIHLTLVPFLKSSNEIKTKPTQHSVKELRSIGIQPDIVICRSQHSIPLDQRNKISLFLIQLKQ